ncbi:excinuclease ABC subunit B [Candidatus Roizmanbacteria bacterium RIFCSPHIGHO2_01_FULL_35_10]|uniref:UvrABC system protein B n=1 Tax=Candidatus Roizmanbacteria bacterium RIFCSPLOWO2_01_FULL_35_13 TaxID=1802055 RepID=A0A1F7IHL4_9BACT|nr:MAG: excinuclease ABC subunit B [Candidatus Roizmanbacteria bacterium RIFCSPHIGHO2_01_FULL_35_10]OGK42823.1 MAG: excinuclease ABC subunit B [Candidatus Roizmanbacteria bacterium RIFCSPLOWO2_01_FULL_35_13]
MFKLSSRFKPTGDQPQAIEKLTQGIKSNLKNQVLLGVTGSGKTFTMANVIQNLNMPALIISHNKTLAGQLYQEMRDFFPTNEVSYFVSYYDFYQPEAYIPTTDTYIEKEAEINELIDKLRLRATTNILIQKDVIVVASVSCIYNIGSPVEYGKFIAEIKIGETADWNKIARRMIELLYDRSEFEFKRGTFRIRGNYMDIYPAYEDFGYRLTEKKGKINEIIKFEPLSGKVIVTKGNSTSGVELATISTQLKYIIIYPAKHYLMNPDLFKSAEAQIRTDLKKESAILKAQNKTIEAERLIRKVNYDLEMIKEVGYVNGIENYSRYFDGRKPGDPPNSLLNYFKQAYGDNFLVFIDESHMTVPQLRGMYNGDHARKKTLIDFGFRLNAAYDNRPLRFDEFYPSVPHLIYVSATPNEWETKLAGSSNPLHLSGVTEQLVRPTGIVDPQIIIRPAKNEVQDLIKEVEERVKNKEKILVTTLTKKIAEDLTEYLKERKIRACYLHSDIQTLERSDILDNLRKNEFDVLIGVNLLREGLDLPEVSLVAILDADKEGFLRSKTSLIQTMGRASRNITGEVIMYADVITKSIKGAVEEIDRRRSYQNKYNQEHHIEPKTIYKPVREKIIEGERASMFNDRKTEYTSKVLEDIKTESLTPYDKKRTVKKLELEMKRQAEDLNFEFAIKIRDKVNELKES